MDLDRLEHARQLLRGRIGTARVSRATSLRSPEGSPVYLQLEADRPTGSFKIRGALYALEVRQARDRIEEVVASSTGNHGAAVAWAAFQLGVRARIFLPRNPNRTKRERILALGADVEEEGEDIADAYAAAKAYVRTQPRAFLLNDADDPDVPVGTGTIGLDILDAVPDVGRIIVPVGDTALIRGIAGAVKARRPDVRIVGVQSERAPSYALSWKAGRPVPTERCDTIADGLATRLPIPANVEAICRLVDEFVLVPEDELLDAVAQLFAREGVLAEPAGAAAVAGLSRIAAPAVGLTVLVVSGGNPSPTVLRALADRLEEPGR